MTTPNKAEPAPHIGRRDPAGRRRAITRAAAELMIERGPAALTHRAVAARAGVSLGSTTRYFESLDALREAALAVIAADIDAELDSVSRTLAQHGADPERLAAVIGAFLADSREVRASLALVSAAVSDPRLREIALRWSDRFVEIVGEYVGVVAATALQVYLDGATIHAALSDAPLPTAHLNAIVTALAAVPTTARTHP